MDLAALQYSLQTADLAALLVPPRILRRVIKRDREPAVIGLQVPHRKSHVIGRDRLLEIADRRELGIAADADLPAILYLIARPDPDRIARMPEGQALIKYWRLLFHCRVHAAFNQRCAEGQITEADVRRRIHQIGQAEFEEARKVLRQERFLLPPHDDRTVYSEFAAVYLELRHFGADALPHYFPSIDDFDRVDAILAADIDAGRLFTETRLRGAPDPVMTAVTSALESAHDLPIREHAPAVGEPSEARWRALLTRADRARAVGNAVRSAILCEAAARVAPPEHRADTRAQAEADLDRLVERLQPALDLNGSQADEWRAALPPLVRRAARGVWPVEVRLLYDLQKVCVDHERGIYAVDVVEWALWLGKRPIKRPLPNQREVLTVKHLRKAARRLARARLADPERHHLGALLRSAVEHSEARLRDRLRPLIYGAFDKVGLRPENYPERVALHKLVEELLDRITERGFFNIGDLRDALSRNNLKLPDLGSVGEFLGRDPLLRLDHEFAIVLDGIYHRAEVYMRWLQRFSSAAFGTPVGRFLTRYLILPFGGAYVVLEGFQHLIGHVMHWLVGFHYAFTNWMTVGFFGLFLLGLFYVPTFRRRVGQAFRLAFLGMRGLFYDVPAAVVHWPPVQRFLKSPPIWFFDHFLLTPLVFAGLTVIGLLLAGSGAATTLAGGVAVFLAAAVLFNSRLGRNIEEALTDWLIRNWDHFRGSILPGLFGLVMDFFKWLIEVVERLLYSVDEWLRFKSGESRSSLMVKAALGVIWFYLTYIIRFAFNVLIEPQINPIKHFPVVTVSHKLLLPTIPSVATVFQATMDLDRKTALGVATTVITSIPGIFGFLVWELKENWKLYRANRPAGLKPVRIGHHGETMQRLLKPGFHSGTLPKLFARLRKAERRAHKSGNWKAVHAKLDAIHHVEESVRHFIEREFVVLLRGSKSWACHDVDAGAVDVGTNRVRFEVCCPHLGGDHLQIAFEELAGWLVAGVARPGWLPRLGPEQARALRAALAGLYKLAGVHLVREQIDAWLEPASGPYDITDDGLIVWPAGRFEAAAAYDLDNGEQIAPQPLAGALPGELPVLAADCVLFQQVPVPWEKWVAAWEQDQAGKGLDSNIAPGVRLLPDFSRSD
jgi:hypothetical protein